LAVGIELGQNEGMSGHLKLSLGSWAFSFGPYADHPVPFDQTVKRLAKAGYEGVEICGFPPHVTLERYSTLSSRQQLVAFLGDQGVGVSGYAADFTEVNPVNPGNRTRYLDLFERNLEMAADIGSPAVRVDSGAAPGSIGADEYAAAFDRLAGIWHEAVELAARAGVRVVWEFEPGFAFNKPSEVIAMHDKVGHPNFRILFDTCHAHMCAVAGARQAPPRETLTGGVPELLNRLKARIGAIHLIDSDGTLYADETSTHRPFGEGLIDFEKLAPQLLAVPGIEWWCVDLCFWPGSWDLVESSREFVARLLRVQVPA
jgi:sugar phosphate isomerase/epimerase